MTDREKIIRLGTEIMGWESAGDYGDLDQWCFYRPTRIGKQLVCWWNSDTCIGPHAWNPFVSITEAHELEGALPEEKQSEYMLRLQSICVGDHYDEIKDGHVWALLRRTPAQICAAALATLGEKEL